MQSVEYIPFHADAVLAAIDRHSEAWSVFQVAPDGGDSERANDEMDAALTDLLATPCASRPGAFCLLRHLRWWLAEEAVNADAYGDAWKIAQAREADLTLLLGCDGVQRIPVALPSGRLAVGTIERMPRPAAKAAPLAGTVNSIGEIAAACVVVIGGCILTGLSTLL